MDQLPPTIEVPVKPWYESRTIWLNIFGFAAIVLGLIIDSATPLALPPQFVAYLGLLLAVANAALRYWTVQPIGASSQSKVLLDTTIPNQRRRKARDH